MEHIPWHVPETIIAYVLQVEQVVVEVQVAQYRGQ